MKTPILAAFMFAAAAASAGERYVVKDEGIFAPTGRHIEFADRYGWRAYETKFDFGIEPDGRSLPSLTVPADFGGALRRRWGRKSRKRSYTIFQASSILY